MNRKEHWEHVYRTKAPTEVSWYQGRPTRSMELLDELGIEPETRVIDVGGGDSTLVDALLERHVAQVTVLDLSAAALDGAKVRLGVRAAEVQWVVADVTAVELTTNSFDIWHDRAVFHFLVDEADRRRYVAQAARSIRPGGALVIGTFALDGPTRCSSLDVVRYSPETLAFELGDDFEFCRSVADIHKTPGGAEQSFTFALLRRRRV